MADSNLIQIADRRFPVACEGEVIVARRCVKEMTLDAGFDSRFAEEIAIVVSELAFNIAHHAGRGHICFRILQQGGDKGVEIEAGDEGHGIADVAGALADGYSTSGGLGCGLGAVNRLMDRLDILSTLQGVQGTRIHCTRWIRAAATAGVPSPGEVGIVSRAKPGQISNGDSYLVMDDGRSCLAAVIDGVGHGDLAHQAAMAVRHYIETHSREPLERIIAGAAYNCQSTRGAVISLVRIDWVTNLLEQAGIGNIETRLLSGRVAGTLLSRRGILGMGASSAHINRHSWNPGDLLVMLSDGLVSSWSWDKFPMATLWPAQQFARELFDSEVRGNDDATVLVVKYRSVGEAAR